MYDRSQDRFNKTTLFRIALGSPVAISPIPQGVDIVMTHGPAANHLDLCERDGNRAGCEYLWRALERVKPQLHCCGHIHEGYGVELVNWNAKNKKHATQSLSTVRMQENGTSFDAMEVVGSTRQAVSSNTSTILVNASVLDENHKATHAPILVKLPLAVR